ncbi:MAG: HEAT repeat domain-containing protein [Candidatus Thorarchaeota archaeon]
MSENQEIQDTLQQLNDEDENVRSQAALSLGWIGDEEVIEPLINILQNDESPKVRANAAMAIGQLGSEKAINSLLHSLNDTDHNVRGMAVYSLGLMKSFDAIQPIIQIMQNDPDKETRIAAIDSLSQISDSSVIDSMVKIFVSEENNEIKSEIKKALIKICDQNDIKDLDERIEQCSDVQEVLYDDQLKSEREEILDELKKKELEQKRIEQIHIILEKLPSMLDLTIHEEIISYENICQYFDCDDVTLERAFVKFPKTNYKIELIPEKKSFKILKPQAQLSDEAIEKIRLLRKKMGMTW